MSTVETRALLREIVLTGGVMRPTAEQRVAVVQLFTAQAVVDVGRGFVAVPEMDADTLLMARGLMLDLELNPDIGVPDGVPGWAGLLEPESRRAEVYSAARDWLLELGLVRKSGGLLHDNTGDEMRSSDRPRFVPDGWDASARWEPVPVSAALAQRAPAPLPTPSGTAHSAPTVELEPVAPKPRVAEKVAAPVAPKQAPVTAQPVAAPAADPSGPLIADHLGQLTALLAAVVSQGRLEPSPGSVEATNRAVLCRRIAVLLSFHGEMTRSQMIRTKLSDIQADALRDALDYGVARGAWKRVPGSRWRLVDHHQVGLTDETMRLEQERIVDRAAKRAAREANRKIEAARDRVTA